MKYFVTIATALGSITGLLLLAMLSSTLSQPSPLLDTIAHCLIWVMCLSWCAITILLIQGEE